MLKPAIAYEPEGHMQRPRQIVMLAGGRGQRMRPVTDQTPKAMIRVGGKPFVEHIVGMLGRQGFERVLFLLGYLGTQISSYFGNGRELGLDVQYSSSDPGLQTASRMRLAWDLIEDSFLLCYCDNFVPLDYEKIWEGVESAAGRGRVVTYAGIGMDPSRCNVRVGSSGLVTMYDPSRSQRGRNAIDLGFMTLEKSGIERLLSEDRPVERCVYPALGSDGRLMADVTGHQYYGVGTPTKLEAAQRYFEGRALVLIEAACLFHYRDRGPSGRGEHSSIEWRSGARAALAKLARKGIAIAIGIEGEETDVLRREFYLATIVAGLRTFMACGTADIRVSVHYVRRGNDRRPVIEGGLGSMLLEAQRACDANLDKSLVVGTRGWEKKASLCGGAEFVAVDEGQMTDVVLDGVLSRKYGWR